MAGRKNSRKSLKISQKGGDGIIHMIYSSSAKIFFIGALLTLFGFIVDNYFLGFISMTRNSSLTAIFSLFTFFGEIEVFGFIAIIVSIYMLLYKKRIMPLWAATIMNLLIVLSLKFLINRPRPYQTGIISSLMPATLNSFPSGHAAALFCMLPFISEDFPRLRIFFWILAFIIAFSRLYLGVHYLSDVIAGAFIGYALGRFFIMIGKTQNWR